MNSSDLSGNEEVVTGDDKKARKESKGLMSKKEKKEKKQKEKETRYAYLGHGSSGEDDGDGRSPAKSKLSKPFIFGSAKKDKKKDWEAGVLSEKGTAAGSQAASVAAAVAVASSSSSREKKEKKDKPKLKLKKNKNEPQDPAQGADDCPVFGVPLEVAVERNRCHDGVPLPRVVRQCIDYIEENGLMMEGVYRSSGVKSKVNKLRALFNSRQCKQIQLSDYEPAVVASVLKQYLRELPEPVLTSLLMHRFEEVSALSDPLKRLESIKGLISELPECNRTLLQWIFVHMGHVIERERFNKMTLQNVSIVLSPTMRISHRVLNCLFENRHTLFDHVQLKKYVPPITSDTEYQGALPDSPLAIQEEILKQESLLADLHLQISSGAASKKTEEQIWEQQRIVTQLKRKLRAVQKNAASNGEPCPSRFEPIDYEEDLNFSLQEPESLTPAAAEVQPQCTIASDPQPEEHKVSVKVHLPEQQQQHSPTQTAPCGAPQSDGKNEAQSRKNSHITVIQLVSGPNEPMKPSPSDAPMLTTGVILPTVTPAAPCAMTNNSVSSPADKGPSERKLTGPSLSKGGIPLLPPPPASNKMRSVTGQQQSSSTVQILRPVPVSPKHHSNHASQGTVSKVSAQSQQPATATRTQVDASCKSKSLPRGLPSDGSIFASMDTPIPPAVAPAPAAAPVARTAAMDIACGSANKGKACPEARSSDDLHWELLQLKYEYEELMGLRSELEYRKRAERNEMEELREEIATMQTLYQYRTYSVDSSENSSDENSDKDGRVEVEELSKILSDLVRENSELQEKRLELCDKIEAERAACVHLRVQIRLEQERIKLRQRAGFT